MATINNGNPQYRDLLQALTACINDTRIPFDEDMPMQERQLHMREMDLQRKHIERTMSALLSSLGNDRNWYSPAFSIVDEVLIEIWLYLPLRDRISAAQVCHRWRTVALDAKMLWTEINVEAFSTRKVAALLARSGRSPLHITAGNKKPDKWSLATSDIREATFHHNANGFPIPLLKGKPPKPYFQQSMFDQILGRAERLDATVGTDKSFYVTRRTLKVPMPHLKQLTLREETRTNLWGLPPSTNGSAANNDLHSKYKEMPDVFFSGVTPLLQDVSFTVIHAPWDDPIYHNLTRLSLSVPRTRVRPSELLRLLVKCPRLVHLGLNEAMSPILHNRIPNPADIPIYLDPTEEMDMLHLNYLQTFNLEESDAAVIPKLMAKIIAPALENPLMVIPDTSCMVDHRNGGGPFQALRRSFSQTTTLDITGNNGQLSVCGYGGSRRRRSRPLGYEWNVVCRPRMRSFPSPQVTAFANFANNVNTPWNPITQLHPPMGVSPLCDVLQFLHVMERTGVDYSQVEKVSITGNMDGTVYRSVFLRCPNLKALIVSAPGGMGMLKECMNERHCPSLTMLHMDRYSEPASDLAEWLEQRKKWGFPLRCVVVSVQPTYPNPGGGAAGPNWDPIAQDSTTLDEPTRRRIEAALVPGPSKGRGRSKPKFLEWRSAQAPFGARYRPGTLWDDGDLEDELEAAAIEVGLTGESMQMVLDATTGSRTTGTSTPLTPIDTTMAEADGQPSTSAAVGTAGSPVSPETPLQPISLNGNVMSMFSHSLAELDEDEEWAFTGPSMWL